MVSEVKTCKDCGQTKPREEFHRVCGKKPSPGCREARCKPCSASRRQEWYRDRKIAAGKQVRAYHKRILDDPEYADYCDRQRLRRWERSGVDPNTREFRDGRWRIKPEFRVSASTAFRKQKTRLPQERFATAKRNAKLRGLDWTIPFEDFAKLITQPCHYWPDHKMPEMGCGLDRIENTRGYHLDNVLPCCAACNQTRSNKYSVPVFKAMVVAGEQAKLQEVELSVQSNQPQRIIS